MMQSDNNKFENSSDQDINIIYFRGSKKTKSITLKLKTLRVIIYLSVVISFWSIISSILLYYTTADNYNQKEKFQKAKSVIFQMQSRYEKIYDIHELIPSKNLKNKTKLEEKMVAVVDRKEDLVAVDQKKNEQKIENEEKNKITNLDLNPQKEEPAGNSHIKEVIKTPEALVDIKSNKIWQEGSFIHLNFSIRNKKKNKKINGYIWGYVKLKRNGHTILKSYPKGIRLNEKGKLEVFNNRGVRFKIRKFKKEDLKIYVGSLQKNEIMEVGVYIKDNGGSIKIGKFDTDKLILQNKFSDEAKADRKKLRYQ